MSFTHRFLKERMLLGHLLQSDDASDVSHNNLTLTVGPDLPSGVTGVSEDTARHQKEAVNESALDDILSTVDTEIHPGSSVSCANMHGQYPLYSMQSDFGFGEFSENTEDDDGGENAHSFLEEPKAPDQNIQPLVIRSMVPLDFLVPRSLIRLSRSLWNQTWSSWLSTSPLELFLARWQHSDTETLETGDHPFRLEVRMTAFIYQKFAHWPHHRMGAGSRRPRKFTSKYCLQNGTSNVLSLTLNWLSRRQRLKRSSCYMRSKLGYVSHFVNL